MYPDKFVSKPSDIPTEEHYAIFEGSSYYSEGYDRHDPGQTNLIISYEAYLTKDKLMIAIEERESSKFSQKEYKVCRIIPIKVQKTITLKVE